VAWSGGARRSSGRGILIRAERDAREDARRPRRCSPATRSSGRPAMARQRNSLAAARVGARRECGGLIGGEGQLQDPRVGFIEREGGRGGDDREQWP
jgi:hypothetical protein